MCGASSGAPLLVAVQIDCGDKTAPHTAERRRALDVDEAVFFFKQAVIDIALHRRLYAGNTRFFIAVAEIDFRQNEVQRARFSARRFFRLFPIISVLRILIARDARPARRVDVFRQQNVGHGKGEIRKCVHRKSIPPSIFLCYT